MTTSPWINPDYYGTAAVSVFGVYFRLHPFVFIRIRSEQRNGSHNRILIWGKDQNEWWHHQSRPWLSHSSSWPKDPCIPCSSPTRCPLVQCLARDGWTIGMVALPRISPCFYQCRYVSYWEPSPGNGRRLHQHDHLHYTPEWSSSTRAICLVNTLDLMPSGIPSS